ncbi:hypothetical protein IWW50_001630 [Coemansia erecta]|nr:hypothetical protein IWW50_001630 [Coemansia erecta]
MCSAFEPIEPGTPGFILYVIFVQLFLPFIALTYNVVTSLRVIFMLHSQQRQLNQMLREIMQESNDRYMGNIDDEPHTSIVIDSEKVGLRSLKTRRELEANIIVMRRFNSAVIRIALYPFAPIAWWIINAAYYGIQYPLTMTHTEDANRWVSMASLAWFSMPAIAIANFLVFVTDPAFVKVVKQVHKRVLSRFICKQAIHAEQADDSMYAFKPTRSTSPLPGDFDTLVSKHGISRKPQITETSNADNMSLGSIFESPYTPPDFEAEASAPTNEPTPQGQSSSVMHAYGEMVRRHPTVGNNTDANLFYSRM